MNSGSGSLGKTSLGSGSGSNPGSGSGNTAPTIDYEKIQQQAKVVAGTVVFRGRPVPGAEIALFAVADEPAPAAGAPAEPALAPQDEQVALRQGGRWIAASIMLGLPMCLISSLLILRQRAARKTAI